MKHLLIAALVFCVKVPSAMGAANVVNSSRSNIKNNLVSTGTTCTTNGINLDVNGNVTGTTTATAPCNVPPGVYPFVPPSLANSPVTLVIPQVVDGGVWKTTLVLTNTTASAATASLTFNQETAAGDGSTEPWTPTFLEGNSTQGLSLAAGGTIFLHTPGTSSTLTEGWGQATVSDGVQIYALFGTAGGGQGTAPATPIGNHILAPYDNTNGNVTAIALANPTAARETVSVSFCKAGKSMLVSQSSITLPANGHMAFLLGTQFPETAGGACLIEFYTANGAVSLIGLQSNPANFFTTAQAYPVSGPVVIGSPDPSTCVTNPLLSGCPEPPLLVASFSATIASNPVQISIAPATTAGTYNAAVSASFNGVNVNGSFAGGTITSTSPITFAFTSVSSGSTFTSGSLNVALTQTSFDADTGEVVGNVTGSVTLTQANVGSGTISGAYAELVQLPAPALTFSLQSQVAGNLSMAVSNTGGAAATNVTITSITGITASGVTFVYVPGLLNPPFVVPGAASLAAGATSGFNLDFTATSGSAATPFSFVITAQADNVPSFTTTINVP
jgi:hypothetical protein